MRVCLLSGKRVEIGGKMKRFDVGDVVDIGKGEARKWIALGDALPLDVQPQSGSSALMLWAREWWFNNEEGTLLDGVVTRAAVDTYGGPNPEFNTCEQCQRVEWKARLTQTPLKVRHTCPTSQLCQQYCDRQGDDRWTHFHQNFHFARGVDKALNAPRCLMIQPPKGYAFLTTHSCDQATQVFLRQFARACQYDLVKQGEAVAPSKYDFVFFVNNGVPPVPHKPIGPASIVYCHDLWKRREERQVVLDAWQPDVIWTPFPSSWKRHYRIPKDTEVIFRPVPASMFFTRPNLEEKELDLLVIGAAGEGIYSPRLRLSKMLAPLAKECLVQFHHAAGAKRSRWNGPNDGEMPYNSAWSAFLGRAKFVAFAGIDDDPQPAFFKFYEVLGCGAVPIMPEAPDLAEIGVVAWEHYVPLEALPTRDDFKRVLSDYEGYKHLAYNAVEWTKNNADTLLFDGFEKMVRTLTEERYPRRLV